MGIWKLMQQSEEDVEAVDGWSSLETLTLRCPATDPRGGGAWEV